MGSKNHIFHRLAHQNTSFQKIKKGNGRKERKKERKIIIIKKIKKIKIYKIIKINN